MMDELRRQLLKAHADDSFFKIICELISKKETSDDCVNELILLHNESQIDIVTIYKQLKNRPNQNFHYFTAREVFNKVLPKINASTREVMECVLHLIKEAGNDLTSCLPLSSFTDFCSNQYKRPIEALKIAKASPELWRDFIRPTIIAGTRIDLEQFFNEAIHLIYKKNPVLRGAGSSSLGYIQYPSNSKLLGIALEHLETVVANEIDDAILSYIVYSICNVCKKNETLIGKGETILKTALTKGAQNTLHAAATIFGLESQNTSKLLLDTILPFLLKTDVSIIKTVELLDYGISYLLEQKDKTQGINFLESFLLTHNKDFSLKSFNYTMHVIYKNKKLLNRLLTRWFLQGESCLCLGIQYILDLATEEPLLEVDLTELKSNEPFYLIFLAHKAIAYLFTKPIACTSIILSLMRKTQDKGTIDQFSDLLFEPLLINFVGNLYEFLSNHISKESEIIKQAVQKSLDRVDDYQSTIESVGNIPELHPSQEQKEMQVRFLNQIISEQYKEAMKKSIVNLVRKITFLYGRTLIIYTNNQGKSTRTEIPMNVISVEMKMPRQAYINPFELEYIINLFKAERIEEQ